MNTELAVIGGGLAGAGFAIHAARAGHHVLLIERETAPHDKVCGEFLSHEAQDALAALGLDLPGLGAMPIHHVQLAVGRWQAGAALPFQGLSLSRRILDAALLDRAAACGVQICRGQAVQALQPDGAGWRLRLADGTIITASRAILASGKHDLRGWPRPPGRQADLLGLKTYWQLAPDQARALLGRTELILFRGGYAGLQLVQPGRANLCLVVRQSRFAALDHDRSALLDAIARETPLLRTRLAGATPESGRKLAIARIPYGYIAPPRADGLWRLGDQAAVIPSFSGDGMSIALHSAQLAAGLLQAGADAAAFQARLAGDVRGQLRLATWLSLLCVHRPGQRALVAAARLRPGLLGLVARRTRLPDARLLDAHLLDHGQGQAAPATLPA